MVWQLFTKEIAGRMMFEITLILFYILCSMVCLMVVVGMIASIVYIGRKIKEYE